MKKQIALGLLCGIVLSVPLTAKAATNWSAYLRTENPVYSSPRGWGENGAWGGKNIYIKVTASKNGVVNSTSKSWATSPGLCTTNKVSGPTYSSSNTKFVGTFTGYGGDGVYRSQTASYSY